MAKSSFGSGLASFGRGYAIFSSIASTIVGLIFIAIGIALITGNITPPAPKPDQNPDDKVSPKALGWIMIVFGLVVMIASWTWTYLTQKYKGAAQAEGVLGGISITEDLLGMN